MNAQIERLEFSKRLQQALHNAEHSPNSPTQLAREFNLRFAGQPVTVHAARKWLQGESIPTQEKLRALAEWLDVPTDWLRFGSIDVNLSKAQSSTLSSTDTKVIATLQQLDEHHKMLAHEFIRMLSRISKKK
jgi:transcriptional regulator with XRE-family HTH domain